MDLQIQKPVLTKSLKNKLIKEDKALLSAAINVRPMNAANKAHLDDIVGFDRDFTIQIVKSKAEFPLKVRSALGDEYRAILNIFNEAVDIHNRVLVGRNYKVDLFDFSYEPEVMEFKNKAISTFSNTGRNLAYKKRRLSTFDAAYFLYSEVLVYLDEITYIKGSALQFLLGSYFDLLAQSYLSRFVVQHIELVDSTGLVGFDVDLKILCVNLNEARFIESQLQAYNIPNYVLFDKLIECLYEEVESKDNLSESLREDMLFDIFELIPLYLSGWDSGKHEVSINDEISIYMSLDGGQPSFIVGFKGQRHEELYTSIYRFSWDPYTLFLGPVLIWIHKMEK